MLSPNSSLHFKEFGLFILDYFKFIRVKINDCNQIKNTFTCFDEFNNNNNSNNNQLYAPQIVMNKTEQIRQHKKMIAYQKRLEKQRIKENKKILKAMLNDSLSNENTQFQIMPSKRGRKPKKEKFLSSQFINELCDSSKQAQNSMNLAQASSNSSLTNDLEDFFKLNHFNVSNKHKPKPSIRANDNIYESILYSPNDLATSANYQVYNRVEYPNFIDFQNQNFNSN
jgi:hypothetical protein